MASGAQHEQASTKLILGLQPLLLLSMAAVAVSLWLGYVDWILAIPAWIAAFGFLFGLYVGRRVTPDKDIDEVMTRQTRRYMARHPILGRLWRIFWWPYAIIHPHRGMAHVPFIGTLGRFVYLFLLPIALGIFLARSEFWFQVWILLFWSAVYAGQASQDLLHIWMDR